jgi:CMP-N-acetylneuraminic acid synthetase
MEDFNPPYDIVMCLHPTSPIRNPEHIDQAVDALWRSTLPTLASVCKLPHKTHNNIGTIHCGRLELRHEGPHYILNASIYAMKRDWLLKHNKHTSEVSVPLVMDRFHSLDVDEETDLKLGELYLNAVSTQRL